MASDALFVLKSCKKPCWGKPTGGNDRLSSYELDVSLRRKLNCFEFALLKLTARWVD